MKGTAGFRHEELFLLFSKVYKYRKHEWWTATSVATALSGAEDLILGLRCSDSRLGADSGLGGVRNS